MKTIILKNQRSVLVFSALCGFVLSPLAQAAPQVVPPPDGCYPGFTTAEGCNALNLLTTGAGNTGIGWYSLFFAGASNFNTGVGAGTLVLNTADSNTAVGAAALLLNTTGTENVAVGTDALVHNDDGDNNTANGAFALSANTTGGQNTASGSGALFANTTGNQNTANGAFALFSNTTGFFNTATGEGALFGNTTGVVNTAIGLQALLNNTTGGENTALGASAGSNQTTGSDNVYIGAGMVGVAGESNACYIKSIFGQLSSGGTAVFVNSAGKLGTTTSSRRFKDDIRPMDNASEVILALKPVAFHYKKEIDPQGIPQFGLVAEEVEKVNADLVIRDREGKVNTVRYDAVNAMVLNEFLKEHKKVEEQNRKIQDQEATIAELKKGMETVVAQLKEQAAQIQKVSAHLEMGQPATKVVSNKP